MRDSEGSSQKGNTVNEKEIRSSNDFRSYQANKSPDYSPTLLLELSDSDTSSGTNGSVLPFSTQEGKRYP